MSGRAVRIPLGDFFWKQCRERRSDVRCWIRGSTFPAAVSRVQDRDAERVAQPLEQYEKAARICVDHQRTLAELPMPAYAVAGAAPTIKVNT